MKKHLLASTALIAAGVLASSANAQAPMAKAKKPFFTVNGYMEMTVGGVLSQKHDQAQDPGRKNASADVHNESEVHFNGHAALDNGITILTRVELEGDGDGNPGERLVQSGSAPSGTAGVKHDTIDEVWMIIRGSFGEVDLGSIDSAGYRMTIGYSGSWATGVGQNLVFDVTEWIDSVDGGGEPFNTIRDSRLRDSDDDAEKISYFTPRFAGFQLGVSYVPNTTQDVNNSMADAQFTYHDGVSIGANFDRKLGGIGVGIATGYHRFAHPESNTLTAGGSNTPAGAIAGNNVDMENFVVAARFDVGPFRVAGSFKRTMSRKLAEGLRGDWRGHNFDVGARYVMGPNQFSIGYIDGSLDAYTDEYQAAILSFARILGPGVKWYASLLYNHSKVDTAVSGGAVDENDGYAMSSGIRLTF